MRWLDAHPCTGLNIVSSLGVCYVTNLASCADIFHKICVFLQLVGRLLLLSSSWGGGDLQPSCYLIDSSLMGIKPVTLSCVKTHEKVTENYWTLY